MIPALLVLVDQVTLASLFKKLQLRKFPISPSSTISSDLEPTNYHHRIAVNLAHSFMRFYSSPWIQDWSLQTIHFFDKQEQSCATPGHWTPESRPPPVWRYQSRYTPAGYHITSTRTEEVSSACCRGASEAANWKGVGKPMPGNRTRVYEICEKLLVFVGWQKHGSHGDGKFECISIEYQGSGKVRWVFFAGVRLESKYYDLRVSRK